MFGAVDASWFMDAAKKEERKQELLETEEGRATLAFEQAKKNAYNDVPVGAKCYSLIKLRRRHDAENKRPPAVRDGSRHSGYVRVLTDEVVSLMKDDLDVDTSHLIQWECQKEAKPKIGSVFMVDGVGTWLRTSVIRSYYVHDDPEGYAEHPDKLVLPEGFPIGSIEAFPLLQSGDIILCTMNSLYLCREYPGYEYKKDFLDATPIEEEKENKTA
jgi:hypothetical protein